MFGGRCQRCQPNRHNVWLSILKYWEGFWPNFFTIITFLQPIFWPIIETPLRNLFWNEPKWATFNYKQVSGHRQIRIGQLNLTIEQKYFFMLWIIFERNSFLCFRKNKCNGCDYKVCETDRVSKLQWFTGGRYLMRSDSSILTVYPSFNWRLKSIKLTYSPFFCTVHWATERDDANRIHIWPNIQHSVVYILITGSQTTRFWQYQRWYVLTVGLERDVGDGPKNFKN